MKIVFLGPPSVGKGTYIGMLKQDYGIPHISTGDLFRENMKNNTELGKKAKEFMDSGQLVPDEITTNMLKERIQKDDCKNGFFLDGFPRTIAQAEALEGISDIDKVLSFSADDEIIISRITGRRTCKKCGEIFHIKNIPPKVEGVCDKCSGELYQREDQKEDIVKVRLDQYNEKTKPLVDFYKEKGLLTEINANADVNSPDFHIIEDCKKVLDPIKEKEQTNEVGE